MLPRVFLTWEVVVLAMFGHWLQEHRLRLTAGVLLWLLVSTVAWLQAARAELHPLETLVTWNEWAAAFLLIPFLLVTLGGGFRMATRAARLRTDMFNKGMVGGSPGVVDQATREEVMKGSAQRVGPLLGWMTWLGVVQFGLALVVRALFGLGWAPFL